jgi:hypothetical protein
MNAVVGGPQGPQGGPAWIDKNHLAAVATAFVLTAFYVAPIYMIAFVAWKTQMFQEDSLLFAWFAAFMKSSDSTLAEFHKVLFPMISALSIIVFRDRPTKSMFALAGFIFVSFVATVAVSVMFDMSFTTDALSGLTTPIDLALVHAFFSKIQETLLMYLMMLLGISVANSSK